MLITTPSLKNSDSYATIEEADTHIELSYRQELYDVWYTLTDEAKEHRLRMGALSMNLLRYRGKKACRDQALAFPRWWTTDYNSPRYPDQYITVEDIPIDTSSSNYYGSPPSVPDEVKKAQIEMAFQVFHSHLLTATSDPMEYSDHEVRSFTLGGGMTIDYFSTANVNSNLFAKDRLQSMFIIDAYLSKWIKRSVGGVA